MNDDGFGDFLRVCESALSYSWLVLVDMALGPQPLGCFAASCAAADNTKPVTSAVAEKRTVRMATLPRAER